TRLVEQALHANTDLRASLARLEQARAITRQSKLDLFPTVTAQGDYAHTRSSAAAGVIDEAKRSPALAPGASPGATRDQRDGNVASASADAFWELDLFG